jgi:hypothetical protein
MAKTLPPWSNIMDMGKTSHNTVKTGKPINRMNRIDRIKPKSFSRLECKDVDPEHPVHPC